MVHGRPIVSSDDEDEVSAVAGSSQHQVEDQSGREEEEENLSECDEGDEDNIPLPTIAAEPPNHATSSGRKVTSNLLTFLFSVWRIHHLKILHIQRIITSRSTSQMT